MLFWPLLATFVFFCVLAHGVVCLTFENWWADEICPEIDTISIVQIAVGILGPCILLNCFMTCHRQSRRDMELDAFYGDALLEAMLAGDTIYEHYTVRGTSHIEKGTIVFVSGLACPRVINNLHTRHLSKKFRTISVDLPGQGTMSGVQYSIARCVRVLKRVVDNEVAISEQQSSVILVGYGSSGSHVVMSAAKQNPGMCSGIVVCGDLDDVSCCCWFGSCCRIGSGTAQLLRESWAAELFTHFYQRTLDDCNDHMNMRQAPQSFHWDMTMDWFREVRGRSIDNMFVNVSRPILAMSSSKYTLARIRRLDCDNVITVRVNGLSGDILPSCEKSDLKKMHDAIEAFSSENMMLLPFMESGLDDSPIFIESMKMDDDEKDDDDDAVKPSD